ncbi:hypothetical protein [Aeromonas rivipollensis]|uniref:Uncharacterized protein n=1 Tax=Aeromonas rivipollensis TaxID=948519 RepID=A0AAW9Y9X6_9GAMM|nr:hypothetical protein [Aeromonas rivipollensis]NEX75065.1 hypothetical protein [Aeromonas rivipollensis]
MKALTLSAALLVATPSLAASPFMTSGAEVWSPVNEMRGDAESYVATKTCLNFSPSKLEENKGWLVKLDSKHSTADTWKTSLNSAGENLVRLIEGVKGASVGDFCRWWWSPEQVSFAKWMETR